ncbi:MAG: site-2 protease family protein [Saprospiraceae bacterium]|nr:site-2 protease family protein [Saprospiraceae bacterium]
MFSSAYKIAEVWNIPIRVHWTFGFFFLWIAYLGNRAGMDLSGTIMLCVFAIALFFCVVLHELGHAMMARRYQVKTKDIIISPIGGLARLMRMPNKPRHELLIAIAGPAVNFVIALVIGLGLLLFTSKGLLPTGDPSRIFNDLSNFLPALFGLNLLLIVFNLIPAFPMDGGRIFRALLSMRWSRIRATQIATVLGQAIALAFVMWGFYRGDFILAFIGIFVFFSAANEFKMVKADKLLTDTRASDVLRRDFTRIYIDEKMSRVIDLVEKGEEKDFVVLNEWHNVVGVLHEEFILAAKQANAGDAYVEDYLSDRFEEVPDHLDLKVLFHLFQHRGYSIIPVMEIGRMIGVIDRTTLNTYISDRTKLWSNWKS